MVLKILNLYAGIGGNRKLWDQVANIEVTAVEKNLEIAEIYRDHFPEDKVVVADAHEYLKENYKEFDFIWTSPPCPTHSRLNKSGVNRGQIEARYPDMKLYEEIIFLKHWFEGDYVVENVKSYYDPLVPPQETSRHYFWSNFKIPKKEVKTANIEGSTVQELEKRLGYNLDGYSLKSVKKGKTKVLRNCVDPKIGKAILESRNEKETKLTRF